MLPEVCWLGELERLGDCELEGVDWPCCGVEAFAGCALSSGPVGTMALVKGRQWTVSAGEKGDIVIQNGKNRMIQ